MPEQQYDAFISYRHLPLDMAVASRAQKLLESYKPPKSISKECVIGKIFRDQTELPTSGDLGDSLQRALRSSRFLIVVLSPKLKESKWCMEEIRSFKEAHGGQIDHILPILAEGEPADSIPDILRHETRKIIRPDSTEEWAEVEVEPLCCDIRSNSVSGSLKKLKTEFLRLAAPILGVGYDDLYRRNQRKKHRHMAIVALASSALFATVTCIVSYFAVQTYQAKQSFQNNLVDLYAHEGASQIVSGDDEKALLYYSSALNLDSSTQAAKTGALLLLQQQGWLNRTSSEKGIIVGNMVYRSSDDSFFISPYAMDSSGKRFLIYSSSRYQILNEDGSLSDTVGEYGDFISGADDGSSWTFVNKNAVTFYFPDDGSVVQINRPKELNPSCSTDTASLGEKVYSWAGAFDKEHAVICCGGYLYLYDLDVSAGTSKIADTYDLATIFEIDAAGNNLLQYCEMWIDSGGHMCVIYNGNTAAVVNSHNSVGSCLSSIHQSYGRNLQNVAFSKNGEYYALVYGNDIGIYNPGGCVEVYNIYGERIMATEFDGGVPLKDAVFQPDGKQIAVWGNGIFTVYDCQSGKPITAALHVPDISEIVWTDDGQLIAETGNNTLDTYVINCFEASEKSSVTLGEYYVKPDYRTLEGKLEGGITVKCTATKAAVIDQDGTEIDGRSFFDEKVPLSFIDRMYTDTGHGTVYLWFGGGNSLLAYKADKNGFTSSLILNTRGQCPTTIHSVYNGIIAEMGNGELFYFEDGKTEASGIIIPNTKGSLQSIASDENGLVSFVIRDRHFTDTYSYTNLYSAELWDLNKFVMLAELEKNSTKQISKLTFSSDCLAYTVNNETKILLLNAPKPDKQLIDTLCSMTCYTFDSDQNTLVTVPEFDPSVLGNWSGIICEVKNEAADTVEEEGIEQKMSRILNEQGEDAWFTEYEKWWRSDEPDKLSDDDIINLASDFVCDSWNRGHKSSVKAILECAFEIISRNMEPDTVTEVYLTAFLPKVLFYSPENSALVSDYYLSRLSFVEEKYNSSNDINDLIEYYALSLDASSAFGLEPPAFEAFLGEISDSSSIALLLKCEEMLQNQLLIGNAENAAAAWNMELNLYADGTKNDIIFANQCLLFELGSRVKLGNMSEELYSSFVEHLDYHLGCRIMWLTSADLNAGLRIGDLITSVNGIYFGQWQYVNYMDPYKLPVEVTVLRNGSELAVNLPSDWNLGGVNDFE